MAGKGTLTEPVIGVASDAGMSRESVRARSRWGSAKATGSIDEAAFAKLVSLRHYVSGDYRDQTTFDRLKEVMGPARHLLYYLAVPPSMFEPVIQGIEQTGELPAHASSWRSRSSATCNRRAG